MEHIKNLYDSEETIFLQAIDQNYQNYKITQLEGITQQILNEELINSDFDEENINLNFDFIDFNDDFIPNSPTLKPKKLQKNFSNSTISNESTEGDNSSADIKSRSTSFNVNLNLTNEKKKINLKDFLITNYEDNNILISEISKQKNKIKSDITEKIKNQFKYIEYLKYYHANNRNLTLKNTFNFNYINNLNKNNPISNNKNIYINPINKINPKINDNNNLDKNLKLSNCNLSNIGNSPKSYKTIINNKNFHLFNNNSNNLCQDNSNIKIN